MEPEVSRVTGNCSKLTYDMYKENLKEGGNVKDILEEVKVLANEYLNAVEKDIISRVHAREAIQLYAQQVAYIYYRSKGKTYATLIALYTTLYIYEVECG